MAAALAGLVAAVVTALAAAGPAWAADPPDVTGLSIPAAQQALTAWDKAVVLTYVPSLKELPAGLNPAAVVVASSRWLNPVTIDPEPPNVEVDLGTAVPDLTGVARARVPEILAPLGLAVTADPDTAGPDWVVTNQRPAGGIIVRLGFPVTLFFAPPAATVTPDPTSTVEPPVTGGSRLVLIAAIAGTSALAVAILGVVGVSSLRRRARRGRRPPEQIEVHGFPGQVLGPQLTEADPAATVSIRLLPHHDVAAVTLEEVAR